MQTHNYADLSAEELLDLIGMTVLVTITSKEDPDQKVAAAGRLQTIMELQSETVFFFESHSEPLTASFNHDADATVSFA